MLSAIPNTQTNATQSSSLPEGFSQQDKIDAQRSLKSDLKVLTSGQHDVQVEKLVSLILKPPLYSLFNLAA